MSAAISGTGRFQFSVENVYKVKYLTPNPDGFLRNLFHGSTPSWCPAVRGNPLAFAQRPLPSIIMATWRGTRAASISLLKDIFYIITIYTLREQIVSDRQHRKRIAVLVLKTAALHTVRIVKYHPIHIGYIQTICCRKRMLHSNPIFNRGLTLNLTPTPTGMLNPGIGLYRLGRQCQSGSN